MNRNELNFCFKGSRNYVQGPDIFDNVVNNIGLIFNLEKISNIKYSAYTMLHSNADMYLLEEFEKKNFETINSLITFDYDQKRYYIVIAENGKLIECSNDYNEDVVRNNSMIEGDQIILENILPDSITEIIVSMNKFFLQRNISSQGKWIVTKFDYHKIYNQQDIAEKQIALKLMSNFSNKLTKSSVLINGEHIGFLYFSLI